MNLIDLLIAALLVLAVVGGTRVGLLTRLAAWAGIATGLVLATWVVPGLLDLFPAAGAPLRLAVGVVALTATVTASGMLFQHVGLGVRRQLGPTARRIDTVGGAAAGVVGVGLLAWLVIPVIADIPGDAASAVRSSGTATVLNRAAPPPPTTGRTVRALVDTSRFPQIIAELQPAPETGPPPTELGVDEPLVDLARRSTVAVSARGCGLSYEGSGFVAEPGLVVTNAHVVAGADQVHVRRPDGAQLAATVVAFDDRADLALLEVIGLELSPLPRGQVDAGEDAVVLGHPGGQRELRVAPARVSERRWALGRDLYGRDQVEREIVVLAASLRQGDSGAPLVTTTGAVGGVVVAISPDDPGVAYALARSELDALLTAPRTPGEVGRCL